MGATVLCGQAGKGKWNETEGVEGERLRRLAGTSSRMEIGREVVRDRLWSGERVALLLVDVQPSDWEQSELRHSRLCAAGASRAFLSLAI